MPDLYESPLLQHEVLHHPVRNVYLPLVRHELQHPAVRRPALLFVCQLKQHRVDDVEPGELVQRRRRHDDLAASLHLRSLVTRHHGHRETSVLNSYISS